MSFKNAQLVENQIDTQNMYQKIIDSWYGILTSDMGIHVCVDVIHPVDIFKSWLKGEYGSTGIMKDEIVDKETIQYTCRRLSQYMYNYISTYTCKINIETLFTIKAKSLTADTLYRSLLYQRQKLNGYVDLMWSYNI